MQANPPTFEYQPPAQLVQLKAPAFDIFPAAHIEHVEEKNMPEDELYCPTAHAKQSDAVVRAEKYPGGHAAQRLAPVSEKYPGGHDEQLLAPETER
jgi:hypothetical protein